MNNFFWKLTKLFIVANKIVKQCKYYASCPAKLWCPSSFDLNQDRKTFSTPFAQCMPWNQIFSTLTIIKILKPLHRYFPQLLPKHWNLFFKPSFEKKYSLFRPIISFFAPSSHFLKILKNIINYIIIKFLNIFKV